MSPPTNPYIISQLRSQIYYHLDNNLVRNALFLAGRLVSYEPRNAEAAYLLSLCQLQVGQIKPAWDSTRVHALKATHLGCCYVHAQASLDLGRVPEGIASLERSKPLWINRNHWNQHTEGRRQSGPDAAAVFNLRGKLFQAHKDMTKAVECWEAALKLNPFMWDAFTGLCECGANVQVQNIYQMTPDMLATLKMAYHNDKDSSSDRISVPSFSPQASRTIAAADPFVTSSTKAKNEPGYGSSALWEKLNAGTGNVVSPNNATGPDSADLPAPKVFGDKHDGSTSRSLLDGQSTATKHQRNGADPTEHGAAVPSKPASRASRLRVRPKATPEEAVPTVAAPTSAAPIKRTISGQAASSVSQSQLNVAEGARRSRRLLNTVQPPPTAGGKMSSLASSLGLREDRDIKKAKAPTRGRTATTATVGRVVSGNRSRVDVAETNTRDNRTVPLKPALQATSSCYQRDRDALQSLLQLFCRIALGYFHLSRYDCQNAIQAFNSLPSHHRESAYVLACMGRSYYEQGSYADAEKFFIRVRQQSPSVSESMEVYSNVLWHMKNEVELAYLAHELVEIDRLSPQAWCAVGNSFSLQRDHEQALKCFKRATQLNPRFAYGFSLQGHEYMSSEEYDKALDAYRSGVNADLRHYNAWYGLGKVYEQMGKYEFAEQHYRVAARINPNNAVLVCCIGMMLEKARNYEGALTEFSRACILSPASALCRFRKARALIRLQQSTMALNELLILKELAPEGANVFYLLGQVYKRLGLRSESVRSFTTAMNLDPKASSAPPPKL